MPPNFADPPFETDPESLGGEKSLEASNINLVNKSKEDYGLKIFYSSLNIIAHLLIGIVTGISLFFGFRRGITTDPVPLHIVLCVAGYQLLMAEAILVLSPHNGWTANFKFVDKRRAHWILQVAGSALAIAGSIIMILSKKPVNFNTYHGQWGLVAFVFTVVCFFNGLTSQYAYDLRKCLPASLSKLTHICFGIVAFAAASISLCYGFDKGMFRNWVADGLTPTIIVFTGALTAIVILNPCFVFIAKGMNVFKKKY